VSALPDGSFLLQIWTTLADLKVVWQAKNISGGFLISGGFMADLTNSAKGVFLSGRSGGFRVSINKNKKFKLFLDIKK
jgi:hypothetical protein